MDLPLRGPSCLGHDHDRRSLLHKRIQSGGAEAFTLLENKMTSGDCTVVSKLDPQYKYFGKPRG